MGGHGWLAASPYRRKAPCPYRAPTLTAMSSLLDIFHRATNQQCLTDRGNSTARKSLIRVASISTQSRKPPSIGFCPPASSSDYLSNRLSPARVPLRTVAAVRPFRG